MSKKFIAITLLIVGTFLLVFFCAFYLQNLPDSEILFIEKITSTRLPPNTKKIQIADNGEFVIAGKFIIDSPYLGTFEKENLLSKPLNKDTVLLAMSKVYLGSLNRSSFRCINDFKHLSDCKSGNIWEVWLNSKTGELWIQVEYPDMSGDPPPCNKGNK